MSGATSGLLNGLIRLVQSMDQTDDTGWSARIYCKLCAVDFKRESRSCLCDQSLIEQLLDPAFELWTRRFQLQWPSLLLTNTSLSFTTVTKVTTVTAVSYTQPQSLTVSAVIYIQSATCSHLQCHVSLQRLYSIINSRKYQSLFNAIF